ncbi:MAG: cobalt-zinc-cadmium resistance protein CzcA [Arcticibacterium sp.]|jgi:cobalt-zinc-cadmium resistance protein CzcA
MFEKIILFSIKNKLIVGISLLALIIWGIFSLKELPIDAIPDVTNNQVVILTQTPSLATEEVEQFITAPVELQLANLQGVEEIRSVSRQGLSVITVVFDKDIDMYLARQMVAEQIKNAEADIPEGMGTPELAPITTGLGEIYQYTLVPQKGFKDKFSLTDLRTIQDWIVKRQLAGVDGVVEISSFGGYLKEYEVKIIPERLIANGISISDLYDALKSNNANAGGSYIERNDQAYFIRGEGALKSLEEISQVWIKNRNGIPILIKDVAEVNFGHAVRFGAMTRNGKSEAVGAVVLMLKGADSESTIENVKERMTRIKETLPEGLDISVFIDRTKLINKSIKTVSTNLIEGGLIVIFVLVLLMGSIRAGLIVASVIPITMLITFNVMNLAGISANLMSLGAIDFGLLVDCSVIVVEAVLFKLHHDKVFKVNLIEQDTMDDMVGKSASSVLSSAVFGGFIILLVYLPIFSLSGIEGKMFKPMAMTVSIAILIAILLSLTYIPMISSLLLRGEGKKHFAFSDKLVGFSYRAFYPMFRTAMDFPKTVITVALILFVGSIVLFGRLGGEFIPTLEEGDLAVDFQTPSGSSLTTTIEATLKAQKALLANFPEILQVVGRIGSSEVPTDPMPPEMADLMINLKDKSEWTSGSSREELSEKMAAVLKEKVPGTSVEFMQPIQMRFNEMIAGAKSDIVVKIFGEDLGLLSENAEAVSSIFSQIDGVSGVKVERVTGLPQISVNYKRDKLAQYGLNVGDLNMVLNTAFSGQKAGVIFEKEKRFDLVLRLDKNYRKDIENVRQLPIKIASGNFITLNDVADITYKTGPAQISREGTKRRINIGIGVMNRDVESLVSEIQDKLRTKHVLPAGYYYEYGGAFKNLQKAKDRLMVAVPIALLLIFVMLFFTFHSFKQALMIFTAIPLSAIGGIVALWLRDMPFSISAGVGFIALFGVAVLNGIVLIGYLNGLEKTSDLGLLERVKKAVEVRFRPVIMTAGVASLGFLPMAISTSAGAEVQKPLATVVIGGLITATLLTLVVLPILYVLFTQQGKSKLRPKLVSLIGFILLGIWPKANAQIGVEELLKMGDDNNSTLAITRSRVEQSKRKALGIEKVKPTIVQLQYGNLQNVGTNDYSFGIQQSFINPIKTRSLKELYSAESLQKGAESGLYKVKLHKAIRQHFYYLQYINGQQRLLEERKLLFEELFQYADVRSNAGETSVIEKMAVEAQLLALTNKIELFKVDYLASMSSMKNLVNTSDSLLFSFEKVFKADESGILSNANLIYLGQSAAVAEKNIGFQKSQAKPDFNVGLYNQSMQKNFKQVFISAGVAIPLMNEPNRQKVKSAQLEREIISSEISAQTDILETKMQSLQIESLGLKRSIYHYQERAVPEAEKLIEKSKMRYLAGEMSYMEFHQMLLILTELKDELENIWYKYHINLTEKAWIKGE